MSLAEQQENINSINEQQKDTRKRKLSYIDMDRQISRKVTPSKTVLSTDPLLLLQLISFKEFEIFAQHNLSPSQLEDDLVKRYSIFTENFAQKKYTDFFEAHKLDEWMNELLNEELKLRISDRKRKCFDEFQKGNVEQHVLQIEGIVKELKRVDVENLFSGIKGFRYLALSIPDTDNDCARKGWAVFDTFTDMQVFVDQQGFNLDGIELKCKVYDCSNCAKDYGVFTADQLNETADRLDRNLGIKGSELLQGKDTNSILEYLRFVHFFSPSDEFEGLECNFESVEQVNNNAIRGYPLDIEWEQQKYLNSLIETLAEEKYKCALCVKVFKSTEFVKKHLTAKHSQVLSIRLEECNLFNAFIGKAHKLLQLKHKCELPKGAFHVSGSLQSLNVRRRVKTYGDLV